MSLDKNKTMILAVGSRHFLPWRADLHLMSHEQVLKELAAAHTWIGPRGLLESDPTYLQIIPYVLIRRAGKWFTYVRGGKIEEARLRGRLTLGVGGHIDAADIYFDVDHRVDLHVTLQGSARREVAEEVGIELTQAIEWRGLIVDRRDEVGRVHIGVVGVLEVTEDVESKEEDVLTDLLWMSAEELRAEGPDRLEGWTGLCVNTLERLKA
jgi:predicted NUDIX family phosphoesterase